MSQLTAYEQLMLELVNKARGQAGAQPLASNANLNQSSYAHTNWMIATDTFSHTGSGGSSATERMKAAGYDFFGAWASAENLAWASIRAPAGYQDEVQLLHTNLMNSPGHRANLLNDTYRQIGIGFNIGEYEGMTGAFVTQNFARSDTGDFLTGVVIGDKDGDRSYDIGEGLKGVTIRAVSSTGVAFSTRTMESGGYNLALNDGTYTVTFSGPGVAETTRTVTIDGSNLKLDLLSAGTVAAIRTLLGSEGANSLTGRAGIDILKGFGGDDSLAGRDGNDRLFAGAGNDKLMGGAGDDRLLGEAGPDILNGGVDNDLLRGGAGADVFRFRGAWGADRIADFENGIDRIDMRGNALTFGTLQRTRADLDGDGRADDVLIQANGQSIALLNLKASLLGGSDFQF